MKGKRIVVTRAQDQAVALCERLRQRGAEPVLYPCIARVLPQEIAPLDAALGTASIGAFDWLILTSTYTVQVLAQRLAALGLAPTHLAKTAVAAIGAATAEAVQSLLGLKVQVVPESYVAESLAQALQSISQARILLPQADLARPILAQQLAAAGAHVTAVTAYHTLPGHGGVDVPKLLANHQVDAMTFTSSSTVRNFWRRLAIEGGNPCHLTHVCVACIGPHTLQTAREFGLCVDVMPARHTLAGLVTALEAHFAALEK
jgi:uroporphyrinogen-III synthase